jgi:hypothetical protein
MVTGISRNGPFSSSVNLLEAKYGFVGVPKLVAVVMRNAEVEQGAVGVSWYVWDLARLRFALVTNLDPVIG